MLHLDHIWPSRRKRWWCMLINPIIPRFDLRPFPKHPFVPTVGQVLPVFPNWPEEEIQQLLIDEYEYGCFGRFTGIPKVAIDLNQPLPTALHGWGNQLMGCPCGCRSAPLSLGRLQEKGLWGALLPLPWDFSVQGQKVQACRHIHPWELAILTGTVADRKWMPQLKLSLCGLGQMATPFHSAWMASHLIFHTGQFFGWETPITPEQALWAVASRAFATRDFCLPQLQQSEQVASFVASTHKLLFGGHQDRFVPQSVSPGQQEAFETHSEVAPALRVGQFEEQIFSTPLEPCQPPSPLDTSNGIGSEVFDDGYLDPHWDCPFDDCIICIMNGLKPPQPEPAGLVSHVLDVTTGGVPQGDISPTPPFVVDGSTSKDTPEEGPSFSMCGGHPAFSTKKRDSAAIVVSQDEEETQLPTSKRQCLSSEDITKSAVKLSQDNPSIEKTSRNRVIILHRGYEASPQIVCIRPDEPIDGLVIAETKLQQPVQPFRVCDILGQSFGQSNRPQAFQHVFLHDQGPRSSQPCHDACQPPHWFDLMETCSRIKMLYRQEAWIAKDEMDFYIQVFPVSGIARGIPSLVFDDLPGQFEDWVLECGASSTTTKPAVSAVLLDQHWIPFAFFTRDGGKVQVYTSEEGLELARYCGFQDPCMAIPMPRLFDADCGFQTIGWLIHVTLEPSIHQQSSEFGSSFSPVSVPAAAGWRRLFEHHLFVTGKASESVVPRSIRLGGARSDATELKLQDLLETHAVPSSVSPDRVSVILEKLGKPAVVKALRAQRPWAELKALANSLSPKLQLVLPSELEQAIKQRASEGKQVGDKSRKKKHVKTPQIPLQLQPSDISIPDGVFKHGENIPVKQIPLSNIGKESQGVVLVTAHQSKPYISVTKPISQEGLALLVLDHADPTCQGIGQVVQFPARFEQTGEPLITRARLIQLGESEVSRLIPQNPLCVDEVATHVIRALVFRDEFGDSWENFVMHPVKFLLDHHKELVGGSGNDSNIVDVWDRQFVSHKLERLPPQKSDLFIVSIRVTNLDIVPLMSKSGQFATYFEPREDSGRRPH